MAYNSTTDGVRVKVKLHSGNRCRCSAKSLQTKPSTGSLSSPKVQASRATNTIEEPQPSDRKTLRHNRHVRRNRHHLCKLPHRTFEYTQLWWSILFRFDFAYSLLRIWNTLKGASSPERAKLRTCMDLGSVFFSMKVVSYIKHESFVFNNFCKFRFKTFIWLSTSKYRFLNI